MKKLYYCIAVLFLVGSCRGQKLDTRSTATDFVRGPVFAGQFYPADSAKLTAVIQTFLAGAKPATDSHAVAIIVPHAGYIFSGQIAADGYNQVRGNRFDLIVVLGTNHSAAGFTGIAVYPKGAFSTPIGAAVVDDSAAEELVAEDPYVTIDIAVHEKEHSIEVQIPFIKYLFPKAKILPIIISDPGMDACVKFGQTLGRILKNKRALIVAVNKRLARLRRFLLMFVAGAVGMISETVLLLNYQSRSGVLYQDIGILLTTFMVGLAVGAFVINRIFANRQPIGDRKRWLGATLILALAVLNMVIYYAVASGYLASLVVTSSMLALDGAAVSSIFAYISQAGGGRQKAAVWLYSADLIGGSAGSLIAILVLVPVFGLLTTSVLAAAMAVCALAFLM